MISSILESPLYPIINPRSIAIFGASNNFLRMGSLMLSSVQALGYEGKIFPIHLTEKEVRGHEAYTSIMDVPEVPDLAIIVLPTEIVCQTLAEKRLPAAENLSKPLRLLRRINRLWLFTSAGPKRAGMRVFHTQGRFRDPMKFTTAYSNNAALSGRRRLQSFLITRWPRERSRGRAGTGSLSRRIPVVRGPRRPTPAGGPDSRCPGCPWKRWKSSNR